MRRPLPQPTAPPDPRQSCPPRRALPWLRPHRGARAAARSGSRGQRPRAAPSPRGAEAVAARRRRWRRRRHGRAVPPGRILVPRRTAAPSRRRRPRPRTLPPGAALRYRQSIARGLRGPQPSTPRLPWHAHCSPPLLLPAQPRPANAVAPHAQTPPGACAVPPPPERCAAALPRHALSQAPKLLGAWFFRRPHAFSCGTPLPQRPPPPSALPSPRASSATSASNPPRRRAF
mmetsp:Transcript_172506/g.552984  ORF Transcript_172506/g.552984 Transcript_172506/m.552984 type:complete len:231 (-) Transcript_172506:670-1362(-)